MNRTFSALFSCALASFMPACASNQQLAPRVGSSARQASYAESYAPSLEAATKAVVDHEARAKAVIEAMPLYPRDWKSVENARALEIIDAADESGRSGGYVEQARQLVGVSDFFEEERDNLTRRVAGAAQHTVKEKGCDVEVGGTVAYSLRDGVEKQIEKQMRERNEGRAILEKHRSALGRENVAVLEKQADAIALASYIVYVALSEDRARLKQLLSEQSEVAATMDRALEEERAYQAEKGRTEAERKASSERTAKLSKGKSALNALSADAQNLAKTLEEDIPQYRKSYDDALRALRAPNSNR